MPLPANRVIRKRIAARTVAVHLSALPVELRELKRSQDSEYLTKQDLPDKIQVTLQDGQAKVLTRDEAWKLADEAGAQLEWEMLPDSLVGKLTAAFAETGQGLYANYGRPTMDFTGFYHDYVCAPSQRLGNSVMLGPVFIAMDTASAIGFTALGHLTRKARLSDKVVITDVLSTGVYEGTSAWTSAKLGVFTGARAIGLLASLSMPAVHLMVVPAGFLVGAATAIFIKQSANKYKDKAIDALYQAPLRSRPMELAQKNESAEGTT